MSGAALTLPMNGTGSRTALPGNGLIAVENDGVTWTTRADLIDILLPAIRTVLAGRGAHGVAETIKTGPHRTVYRLALPGGEFYFKHFRIAGRKALLQNLIRPSKAELEWRAARKIAELGLPTFEPVALGRVERGGVVRDSFLISRGIAQAIPLDQFTTAELETSPGMPLLRSAACQRSELRQRLAVALGELAARVHGAGVEHADFHAANILVRVGPDGRPALWLIDLHKMHFRRRLSSRKRFHNLANLHQFFAGKSTRSDRLRFYRAYRQAGGQRSPWSEHAEITNLEQVLAAGAAAGWIRADRAWERGNRHVRKCDSGAVACRGLATLDGRWLAEVRDNPERLFGDNLVRWHKQTGKHRVAEIRIPPASSAPSAAAFCKGIEHSGLWRRWLAPIRWSPVRRGWELGHALLRRGIDTPRPLLFVERADPQSCKYYLVTEAVPDSLALPQFLATNWTGMNFRQQRAWLTVHLRRLARQMRRLHDAGFDHRDLKFANLLVASDPADPRIWFLDLDGVRVWGRLPARRAVQNLARINVSALIARLGVNTDRLRFLKWYLADRFRGEWKWWWRRVARASHAKISSNHKRGRIVS